MNERRMLRLGQEVRRVLSEIFMDRIHDPRLQEITVMRVDLSADLKVAHVLLTVMGSGEEEARQALVRAQGFIRGELTKRLETRYVPELRFEILTEEEKPWTAF